MSDSKHLTLSEAQKTGRLQEFIEQQHGLGFGPISPKIFDRTIKKIVVKAPKGGLVGHAKLALKLFAGNAVARGDEKIDRVVPGLKRRLAVLKNRSGAGVNVMTTGRARVSLTLCHSVEGRLDTTGRAEALEAVTLFHHVGKASIIIREAREELTD